MDDLTSITSDDLAASHENFSAERVNVVAKNAVTSMGLRAAARVPRGRRGQHDAV
jgi:bleomycin hydrolase